MEASKKIVAGVVGAGLLAGIVLLAKRTKQGALSVVKKMAKGIGAGVQISEHFNTSEFLGFDKTWKIPTDHYANLERLVNLILEPARLRFGPIVINGGYRPLDYRFPDGKTWKEHLIAKGYHPAQKYSDHYHAGAADTMPANRDEIINYWTWLITNPFVRQCIMYIRTKDKDGNKLPKPLIYNIHVSVVTDKYPKFSESAKHHFVLQDGKRLESSTVPTV